MMTYRKLTGSLMALALTAAVAGCGGAQPPQAPAESTPVSAPSTPPVAAPTDPAKPVAQDPNTPVSSPVSPSPGAATPVTTPPGPKQPATGATAPGAGVNPSTPVTAPPPAPKEVVQVQILSVTPLSKGAHSGVTQRQAVLVTDEQAWQTLWKQHASRVVEPPPAPAIDFSQVSVLAVYMGEQRTGGHSVEVTSVQKENNVLTVTVRETRPGPGTITTMALTQPYHLVTIPKVPANTTLNVQWQ
jgi:hypothetical protein